MAFWLGLAPEFPQIGAIAHTVAEDLVAAREILRRALDVGRAIPGGSLHGEKRIDQMRPCERYQIGTARGHDRVHLIGGGDCADAHGGEPTLVADLLRERR